MRGKVKVGGYSDGPIPWPMKWGTRSLILCGDLMEAVKAESAIAVAHHWGVSTKTVKKWRGALGVEAYNQGTHALMRRTAREHATPQRMRRITALARAAGRRRKPASWRRMLSARVRRRCATRGHLNTATDVIARMGGDEFLVLANEVTAEQALAIGHRIVEAVTRPYALGQGTSVSVGVSVGIAMSPEHGTESEALLTIADAALYAAKSSGKSCCRMANAETNLAALRRFNTKNADEAAKRVGRDSAA